MSVVAEERTRRALARRHGEKLLAEVTVGGPLPARRDAPALLAYAIALAVHGVTVVLAAAGVWFVAWGWGGFGMVPGLFLLLGAWALRPRPNQRLTTRRCCVAPRHRSCSRCSTKSPESPTPGAWT